MSIPFDIQGFVDELDQALPRQYFPGWELPNLVSVVDIAESPIDSSKTLLGDRLLCTGGGMLFVGPSGVGKSSASMMQDMNWGLGRPAFGIKPARPLNMVTIQAENDDGDLKEMAMGALSELQLGSDERELLRANVHYVREQTRTGGHFIENVVRRICEDHVPDIIRLDPLLAYLGSDVNNSEAVANFLRGGLNPILTQYNCAAIINHHTPKITNRDTTKWRTGDWMYAGTGSSDITNWARAILVVEPTSDPRVFKFIAAKRGGRFGWRDPGGSVAFDRYFCHSRVHGQISWVEAADDQADLLRAQRETKHGGRITPSKESVLRIFLTNNGGDPLRGVMSNNEVIAQFCDNGWDKNSWPGRRDALEKEGALAVLKGPHNSKFVGRPAMVEAYRKAKMEKGTILTTPPIPLITEV